MITVKKEKDGTLTLTVDGINPDLASAKVSSSGKSRIIHTTGGNVAVALPDGTQAKLGLNLYVKNEG